jgi:two-component system sensor histidine kinase KdpD
MPIPAASPSYRARPRGAHFGWLRAFGVVALCTVLSELMSPGADLADIIMVYLAGVVYVALHEGARVSVATVVASLFLFDLIFVPPRWGLNPLNPSHLLTLAVMLAVGLLISRLSARAQLQAALAERRAQRAQALSELGARLASARSVPEVEAMLSASTQDTLGLPCGLDADGTLRLPPDARALTREEKEVAEGFARQARLAVERCVFEERSAAALVAAESERLRNTLLSGISHDFRTPLTTIVGAATSLLEQEARLDARMRATLAANILGEARRLHERLSHLLDLARMEEGAVEPHLEWCPADDLVAEALQGLGSRAQSHALRVDVGDELIVWCDPRLVEQALLNLVDNALRYTPPGTRIVIGARAAAGQWMLTVRDDGPGLPPGLRGEEPFRRFRRGQRESAGTGFGLGLAICAAVAKLHGGTITAASEDGATFTMTLPQPVREHAPEAESE